MKHYTIPAMLLALSMNVAAATQTIRITDLQKG